MDLGLRLYSSRPAVVAHVSVSVIIIRVFFYFCDVVIAAAGITTVPITVEHQRPSAAHIPLGVMARSKVPNGGRERPTGDLDQPPSTVHQSVIAAVGTELDLASSKANGFEIVRGCVFCFPFHGVIFDTHSGI